MRLIHYPAFCMQLARVVRSAAAASSFRLTTTTTNPGSCNGDPLSQPRESTPTSSPPPPVPRVAAEEMGGRPYTLVLALAVLANSSEQVLLVVVTLAGCTR